MSFPARGARGLQTAGSRTALNDPIADWAKLRDINPGRYQLQMLPPPAPAATPAGEGEAEPIL